MKSDINRRLWLHQMNVCLVPIVRIAAASYEANEKLLLARKNT